MQRIMVAITTVLVTVAVSAATYYVDSEAGRDPNSGKNDVHWSPSFTMVPPICLSFLIALEIVIMTLEPE